MSAGVMRRTSAAVRRAVRFVATVLAAALVAIVSLAALLPPAAFAAGAVPFDDYIVRVREARVEVSRAEARIPDTRTAEELAGRLSALLPRTEVVDVADGHSVVVDNAVYDSLVMSFEVAADGPARAALLKDIGGHLDSLERGLGRSGQPPAEDPEALARLLGTHRAEQRSAFSEAFSRLVERIGIALQRWWAAASGSPGGRTAMRAVTVAVLAGMTLLIVVVAVRVAVRARRGLAPATAASRPREGADAVVAAAAGLPGDPLAFADALAASGETREALRALFGGAARMLVEAGFVVQARTRTNAELLLEVRPRSQAAYEPLARLCRGFERAWYGHHVPDAGAFAAARADYIETDAALQAALLAVPKAAPHAAPHAAGPAGETG